MAKPRHNKSVAKKKGAAVPPKAVTRVNAEGEKKMAKKFTFASHDSFIDCTKCGLSFEKLEEFHAHKGKCADLQKKKEDEKAAKAKKKALMKKR